ncbi:MAG: phospho-sugar mutase [Bacteroidales bacterium]|nr:phospho-sugar mutase [Bacteroidales bacterium]
MVELDNNAILNSEKWLNSSIDESTKQEILKLKSENVQEFNDAFYKTLSFGTGGLRGIMGIGTNRMNNIVVAMSTQGFANYIKEQPKGLEEIKTVISFDSRNNSKDFATITAKVFAANGFKVFLFENMHPTPLLSFAVRQLKCQAGVMITASHNPKEYNGYKAYWEDGGQLVYPHDENVIEKVNEITDFSQVKIQQDMNNITLVDDSFDEIYFREIKNIALEEENAKLDKNIKIVYTPLHGTGYKIVPEALKRFGYTNVICEPQQSIPDGNFPTTVSPNPEERDALKLGLDLMEKENADILLATDPDADREALTIRDKDGKPMLLNGNQTATLLTYYLLLRNKELGKLEGNEFIVKTIVTSELIKKVADTFNAKCYDVLTGFKWIADKILEKEGKETFIGGGEESYGYMIGDKVRDKDSISTCCVLAQMVSWAKLQGKTLYDILLDIYSQFGYYHESLLSVTRKGKTGAEEIQKMMDGFRSNTPKTLAGLRICMIKDYLLHISKDLDKNEETEINLPTSNVLQFFLEDSSKVSVRPSGTEPKIKFYFGVCQPYSKDKDFNALVEQSVEKIEKIKEDLFK